MTRRRTRAARPMPSRPRGGGPFERGSRMVPRTSPAFPRPRPARRAGFSLRSKLRMVLLSTTLLAVLIFRIFHAPLQAWLAMHGAPGRLVVLGILCLPTLGVLAWHYRQHKSLY